MASPLLRMIALVLASLRVQQMNARMPRMIVAKGHGIALLSPYRIPSPRARQATRDRQQMACVDLSRLLLSHRRPM